ILPPAVATYILVSTTAISASFSHMTGAVTIAVTNRQKGDIRDVLVISPSSVMWLKDALIAVVLTNMYVATAGGKMLRLLAWAVNVTAKPATAAEGVIRFFKTDAKATTTVKAGTLVQTERINGRVYVLATVADVVIPSGVASALVAVKATGTGGAYNLAPGYYRILPVAVDGISQVASEEDWLTKPGADEESDDELRERCRNQFNLVGNYHTDAVYRSMIAQVAGLSIDRIFFEHEAPRGPGTANSYLLLDTGVASAPFIDAVNDYINTQGHHGHGDDMQCFAMPETRHDLAVSVYVPSVSNMTNDEVNALKSGVENLIRCAFRENADFDVKKTWPYSRFSFSQLGRELHRAFPQTDSIEFSLRDITSGLDVPRLNSLTVSLHDD
ncbi:hypothetical protein AWI37_17045, partial [Klebsiella aerogenes]